MINQILALFFTFSISQALATQEYYVSVPLETTDTLKILVEQGFEVGGVNLENKTVSLIVPESKLSKLRALRVVSKRPIPPPDKDFKEPSEVLDAIDKVMWTYPQLVRVESIGKSIERRDIPAVHITNHYDTSQKAKKSILIDAMHHAREVMTVEVALDIIDYLTQNYSTSLKVKQWVDNYDIWVVPMLNPDGNNRVWNEYAMWRKNARGGYGVDINRNYPYAWNTCQGSSGSQNSNTYRGESPGSEPETQAITAFAAKIKPKFNISYHSYSEILIYPFGCKPKKIPEPDKTIYEKYGWELAKKLVRDSGSGNYVPGTSYELLYNVDGGSVDWMYANHKIMAFVIEINSDSQGFQPSYSKWRNITVEKQRAGWQYLLEQMEGPGIQGN